MRALPISVVAKVTGINMSPEMAKNYADPGLGCRQQALALSLASWLNTPTDWLRLHACLIHLREQRKVYRDRVGSR